MAYQLLQGVKVTPRGNYNLSRFSKSLNGTAWPTSYAFGGWIYNATSDIGFSAQPTEIRLNIVLEVVDKVEKYTFFDIRDADLKCDAGNGGDENVYDIDFNGIKFTDFILYSYEISVENTTKILTVVFKDYSIILDKIYVGLIKRQGAQFLYSENATLQFNVLCPDCQLGGNSVTFLGQALRQMFYGSYVGINNVVYDNFSTLPNLGDIFSNWGQLFAAPPAAAKFDLNGGYIILGTEEATEERCGDLAPVSYNFNELLASLRFRGLNFAGAFPVAQTDADFIYHQNYVGSLREVLQQWCSDLGYDFYVQGRTFIGINLNRAIDISQITAIADPTTSLGSQFALAQGSAILSYKAGSSLANTFKQAVITTNNRPRNAKIHSKTPMRYVGYLPLHPIDFNRHSTDPIIRTDAFGTWFMDYAWANNFEPGHPNRSRVLPELDGRTYGDIDTSMALIHYDESLRDLYCQDRALYGETPAIQAANFRALGMVPLVELTDDAKSAAIEALVPGANGDEVSNTCLDKRFYRVFVGYYYESFKQQVTTWESAGADSMYKYGFIAQGLLNSFPYMPQNQLIDLSPTSGFYGSNGTSLLRISHSVQPAAQQYYVMRQAPFKDLVLYSGLLTPVGEGIPIPLVVTGIFPTGLWYGELINDWGTYPDDFKRTLALNVTDPCVEQFQQYPTFSQLSQNGNNIPRFQDWRLENFTPKVMADIKGLYNEIAIALSNETGITILDRTVNDYYNFNYKLTQNCSKLHVMVLTDTRNHPNIFLEFIPRGTIYRNDLMLQGFLDRERDAVRRRAQMKTPTQCDLTLLQEMCRDVLSGKFQQGPTGDPRYGCILTEDKFNYFTEGFTFSYLTQANSRGLNIKLVKNPIRNTNTDLLVQTFAQSDYNGDFYYSDMVNDFLSFQTVQANLTIVYPVSAETNAAYAGILTSDVELENRTPEIVEIYGQPVGVPNNTTTSIKVINNVVEPDLQPQLDPYSARFIPYMTIITGANANIITTIQQYHNYVKQLNNYELTTPWKTVDLTLAGTPQNFGTFTGFLSPNFGLNKIGMSVNDNGVTTSLSFSDRAKQLPKQESILNKIIARLK